MTQSSEVTQLVADARDGSRTAFDELVRVTYADTYTLAYRLTGNEEDARDVVQEAYLRAYRGVRQFRGDVQFSTWLYRITANCASTHVGRRRRHQHEQLDVDSPVIDTRPESDPQARADAAVTRSQLEAALAQLPPRLACGRGSARRLRPSPRVDRRRARHLGDCSEGSSAPSPSPSARAGVQPAVTRGPRMRCDALTELLAEAAEGHPVPDRAAGRTSSTAFGARPTSRSTAGSTGACVSWPTGESPRPQSGSRRCWPRSTRRTAGRRRGRTLRRAAVLGGMAAVTAAGAASVLVLSTRSWRRLAG